MDMGIFNGMGTEELMTYMEFLLWHYRVVDAFWFIYVSEDFDQPTAERLNEKVWGRIAGMAAKDIISKFDIQEKGLQGFVKAMRYFPWCILVKYEFADSQDLSQKPKSDSIASERETRTMWEGLCS